MLGGPTPAGERTRAGHLRWRAVSERLRVLQVREAPVPRGHTAGLLAAAGLVPTSSTGGAVRPRGAAAAVEAAHWAVRRRDLYESRCTCSTTRIQMEAEPLFSSRPTGIYTEWFRLAVTCEGGVGGQDCVAAKYGRRLRSSFSTAYRHPIQLVALQIRIDIRHPTEPAPCRSLPTPPTIDDESSASAIDMMSMPQLP